MKIKKAKKTNFEKLCEAQGWHFADHVVLRDFYKGHEEKNEQRRASSIGKEAKSKAVDHNEQYNKRKAEEAYDLGYNTRMRQLH